MRQRYAETSSGFIASFELIGEQLGGAPSSEDLMTSLRRELHRVHGTAGSLGFHEAGRMAGGMEGLARRWHADPALDTSRRSSIVLNFARALRGAISVADDDSSQRQLVLIGLPDRVADGLVAEGMLRGFAVERSTTEAEVASPRGQRPWGVIAMDDTASLDDVAALRDAPRLFLRRESGSPARQPTSAKVLDAETTPARIIDALGMVAAEGGAKEKCTVLLVDDDPMMLLLVRALAEDEGLDVETAASGAAFRDALERIEPALVVLDIELPDASGVDLLRELRAYDQHAHIPVLMLSGRSDGDARTAAFEAGASDYMLKPIVPAELQRRIAKLMDERRERFSATGLHAATGLPLPERMLQEIGVLLTARAGAALSVCVVRPAAHPYHPEELAAWDAESTRLVRAMKEAGGLAGRAEGPGLTLALPQNPAESETLLRALCVDVRPGERLWHAGIAGTSSVVGESARGLLTAAADAYVVARDANDAVRIWDAADVDIAPDVIVVEDDPSLTDMLEFALGAKGLSYRSYANGPDALDALLKLRPNDRSPIVLLDIDLPGMDGHSLHERIRIERPGVYQIVFLSLHTSEVDQLRALQGGALDYLTKPISLRVLMAKLAVWRERMRRP